MRRFTSAIAAAAVVAAAGFGAACSDSSLSPEDIAGTYVLSKVNNQPVPATITLPNRTFEVESGSLVLRADMTCTFVRTIDSVELTDQCTYVLNEESITVALQTVQETWSGLVTRSIVTLFDPDGVLWEFQLP